MDEENIITQPKRDSVWVVVSGYRFGKSDSIHLPFLPRCYIYIFTHNAMPGKEDDDDDSVGWLLCSTRVIIVFGAFIIATFLPIRQCRRKDTFFACLCLPVSVSEMAHPVPLPGREEDGLLWDLKALIPFIINYHFNVTLSCHHVLLRPPFVPLPVHTS